MATKLEYKTLNDAITELKDFINDNCVDPISDAGVTRPSGIGLANDDDEVKIQNLPKITFEILTADESERIGAGKTDYRRRHRYEVGIIYICGKGHTWTYNSTEFKGKKQTVAYLQYLGNQLVANSTSFCFNELVVGSVSAPIAGPNPHTYQAMLVIKLDSYGGTV